MSTQQYDVIARLYDRFVPDPEGMIDFYRSIAAGIATPILEIGCGSGRLSVALASDGHHVIGVDLSEGMIEMAREKRTAAPDLHERLDLRVGDMRDLAVDGAFDLILIPGGSFEYLLRVEEQKRTLAGIRRLLKPGGRFIFDVITPPQHMRSANRRKDAGRQRPPRAGEPLVYSWNDVRHDHFLQITASKCFFEVYDANGQFEQKYCFQFLQRYASSLELRYLLENSGFRVDALFGDFDKSAFERRSEFMIFVATPAESGATAHG